MGVYSSSFVGDPRGAHGVQSYCHPSNSNWITAHAISTELSIAEVERLWMRFQQIGCNHDGILTPEAVTKSALPNDMLTKNILKSFISVDGNISFETFLRALKWCEGNDVKEKASAIFQMFNDGNCISKDLLKEILSHVYPNYSHEKLEIVTERLLKVLDKQNKGEIEEKDFVDEIINLPVDSVHKLLKFQILPDIMREKIYHGLPELNNIESTNHSSRVRNTHEVYSTEKRPSIDYTYSQIVCDAVLKEVAQKVYMRDWDLLANNLGFLADDIEKYRLSYPSSSYQQVIHMLNDWRSREGQLATLKVLEKSLRDSYMVDVALTTGS